MMFSVIVPCYNAIKSIRKCIDSILQQTYDDFEIIIIDDGSDDGTSSFLDDYSTMYSCIKVYHFPNEGVSRSRKKGIELSTGRYLIFVDADDTINKDLLKKLHSTIKKYSPDIIRYQANLINDSIYKNHQRYNFDDNSISTGIEALRKWSITGKKYAVYWIFAFKRSIFDNAVFTANVNLRCHEDVALIPVLIAASNVVVTIKYCGYNYKCDTLNSLTNADSLDAERARALDFIKAYKYAIENFSKLTNVSTLDIAFFYADYRERLKEKFKSLPITLQVELADKFRLLT